MRRARHSGPDENAAPGYGRRAESLRVMRPGEPAALRSDSVSRFTAEIRHAIRFVYRNHATQRQRYCLVHQTDESRITRRTTKAERIGFNTQLPCAIVHIEQFIKSHSAPCSGGAAVGAALPVP